MNEHMHIDIENPNAHRKELLGINMGIIDVLRRIEKINKIRAKKSVQLNKLNMLTKRISRDMAAFKGSLPSEKEPQFMKKGVKMQKVKENRKKEEAAAVDTDKLSLELKRLKEKIEAL